MVVYRDLAERIGSGSVRPGEKLLPEDELRVEYGVSRDTLRKALSRLEAEGLITRRAALGTFARSRKLVFRFGDELSFDEQMRQAGVTPSSEILTIEQLREPEVELTLSLGLDPGSFVSTIRRLRMVDGQPIALEETNLPRELCPDIHRCVFDGVEIPELLFERYGYEVAESRAFTTAEQPGVKLQKLLELRPGEPVLRVESTGFLRTGKPICQLCCWYPTERFLFSTTVRTSYGGFGLKTNKKERAGEAHGS